MAWNEKEINLINDLKSKAEKGDDESRYLLLSAASNLIQNGREGEALILVEYLARIGFKPAQDVINNLK